MNGPEQIVYWLLQMHALTGLQSFVIAPDTCYSIPLLCSPGSPALANILVCSFFVSILIFNPVLCLVCLDLLAIVFLLGVSGGAQNIIEVLIRLARLARLPLLFPLLWNGLYSFGDLVFGRLVHGCFVSPSLSLLAMPLSQVPLS